MYKENTAISLLTVKLSSLSLAYSLSPTLLRELSLSSFPETASQGIYRSAI